MKDDKKKLEQERRELNTLIGKGVTFEVADVEFEEVKMFFGLIKKHKPHEITKSFTIRELTLSTLDRISVEAIELAIDDKAMQTDDSMVRARGMAGEHAIRCARVIAIAVLGEDRLIPVYKKSGTRWVEDTKRLNELTSLFARRIRPSTLYRLFVLVNAMCNLGDFMNSIRLMQQERTTMPIRIEGNNEG